ncbi:MAG TPA: response regulator transcription factor [Ktedonobacteraceae bacterium]|nr:response regulator transcription factor [Ktedonobacteraceae bacterium]
METVRQHMILVGEPDDAVRATITAKLLEEGYAVLATADGSSIVEMVRQSPISLLLLDTNFLSQQEPTAWCQLRTEGEKAHIPTLLMVTSEYEITYFTRRELYIDDYIKKPLMWEELQACVDVLLRRERSKQRTSKPIPRAKLRLASSEEQVLTAGELRIDIKRYHVTMRGQPIEFNQPLLFDLLTYLVRHRGIVLTRDHLLQQVWGYKHIHDSRTVDVHIHWLREKLEEDPANPKLIQTIRGVGYRFRE